jgi:cytidylate kinase
MTRIVAGDGESKACKSTTCGAIAVHIGGESADAGQFFRGLTSDALDDMGVQSLPAPERHLHRLDHAVGRVLRSGVAFELRDRGDLYRPGVEDLVSVVAARPGVQDAGVQWYERTVESALESGVGALAINGRNPTDRMAEVIRRHGLKVDLNLLIHCDVDVAARRVLMGKKIFEPSDDLLYETAAKIEGRRHKDRSRPKEDYPFIQPDQLVVYEPGVSDPHDIVERAAWRSLDPAVPQHILFDTTHLDLATMTEHATLLADAAMAQAVA